ncbi:shikimate kinase [Microbulbifer sp. 2205BS26-8]|uniref:shikimate kinase n=1 Tax=Microbulbifer sp. 2205BS26-8 TaxID=3064386 RepID=UPI00273ED050|nr:shikimate kinase [Microbulbifer sp. 2205BS26-8]MDP5208207.1 shikimate kinase [Microbulbifer sp. 2205BS26-8]
MRKILIFGNSGSGKSTLARHIAGKEGLTHLDLDLLAWLPISPPRRRPIEESRRRINSFLREQNGWVVEGCHTDLLVLLRYEATEIIFIDLSVEQYIVNARNRPWEPHKYKAKEAQDANLEILVSWIGEYKLRSDTCAYQSHRNFYDTFQGNKRIYTENQVNKH